MPVPPNTDCDVKANDNERDEYDDFPNTRYNTDAHLDKVSRDDERDRNLQDSRNYAFWRIHFPSRSLLK